MKVRRDVFQAIADPTRREIIHLIANKPVNINAVAENFKVTRQAISLHIKILEECGLIEIYPQGRERYCKANFEKLHEVSAWVEQYKQHWESRINALENYLDKLKNERKMENQESTKDRELLLTRLLDAPVALVWEVFTQPDHIAQWWGPDGFTNTIHKMDVKSEGDWELTMHEPDGTDYKNKSVFKEIIPLQKIVYLHTTAPKFLTTIQFEAQGDKTLLTWHMLFESKEQFIQVVKTFKADEGLKQNIEKLNTYLLNLKTAN